MENREIKFRGLTADNKFVYGDLSKDLPNSTAYYAEYSQRICWFPESGGHANQPVKNGTVGQYTGLKDKNEVEIYEGDIVKLIPTEEFEKSEGMCGVRKVVFNEDEAGFKYDDFIPFNWGGHKSVEVVGNIHKSYTALEKEEMH